MSRFRKIARLAEGGFGETFRAWDNHEGVPVVLKQPLAVHLRRSDLLERFDREITRLSALAHPHIVPFVEHGHDEHGLPFLAMRFLPAGSLADRKRPQPLQHLHYWLPAVAAALDFVHVRGVVHRDVKPANIFFDAQNVAYLGDFGIAKIIDEELASESEDSLTSTGGEIGTYPYMAPEYFRKPRILTGAYDQYALAVSVYEMICGRRPFSGDSGQLIFAHATQEPPDIRQFRPDVPVPVCLALTRSLSKKPEERFDNCSHFATEVCQHLQLPPAAPSFQFLCPSCKRLVRVPPDFGGRSCRCPGCHKGLRVSPRCDALWTHEEDPHAVVGTGPKTTRVSEVRQHNSPSGDKPISQRAHMPWGCLTVAAVSLFVALIAMGLLPAGFFEGRTDGVGSLSLAATLIAMGCAVLVFIAALIFGVLGFFTPVTVDHTPESTSRQRAQLQRRQAGSRNLRSAVNEAPVLRSSSTKPNAHNNQLEFSDYLHAIPWYVAIIQTAILLLATAIVPGLMSTGGDLMLSTLIVCAGVSMLLSCYLVVRACLKALGSLLGFAQHGYEHTLYRPRHTDLDGKRDGRGSSK